MDILYYSNFCKHSQHILQYLVKMQLTAQLSCICIDKRTRDVNNNQIYIVLENGQKINMPPNLTHVPSLLCVKKNYTLVTGDAILDYLASVYGQGQGNGQGRGAVLPSRVHQQPPEPSAYSLTNSTSNSNILSESYTNYALSHEELSSKGQSANRPLHNYVAVDHQITIYTPTDDYKPDKVSTDVTLESLQNQRMQDVGGGRGPMSGPMGGPGGNPMGGPMGGPNGGSPPQFSPQQFSPPAQPAIQRHPQADPNQYNYASSNQMDYRTMGQVDPAASQRVESMLRSVDPRTMGSTDPRTQSAMGTRSTL